MRYWQSFCRAEELFKFKVVGKNIDQGDCKTLVLTGLYVVAVAVAVSIPDFSQISYLKCRKKRVFQSELQNCLLIWYLVVAEKIILVRCKWGAMSDDAAAASASS